MTVEQAKQLRPGMTVYDSRFTYRGKGYRHSVGWRVNGKVQTWKTRPGDVRVPIKFGLYEFGYIEKHNVQYFHLSQLAATKVHYLTKEIVKKKSEARWDISRVDFLKLLSRDAAKLFPKLPSWEIFD